MAAPQSTQALQDLERRVSALEQAMINTPGMQGGTLNPAAKEDLKQKFMKNSAKKQEAATVKPDAK